MMENYRLIDIMLFLVRQQKKGYQGLNVLIEILQSNKLNSLRKRFTILTGLRACELYEIGYDGDKIISNVLGDETIDLNDIMNLDVSNIPIPYEIFSCNLRNCIVRYDVILN